MASPFPTTWASPSLPPVNQLTDLGVSYVLPELINVALFMGGITLVLYLVKRGSAN